MNLEGCVWFGLIVLRDTNPDILISSPLSRVLPAIPELFPKKLSTGSRIRSGNENGRRDLYSLGLIKKRKCHSFSWIVSTEVYHSSLLAFLKLFVWRCSSPPMDSFCVGPIEMMRMLSMPTHAISGWSRDCIRLSLGRRA